jgi:hypothetical protein
MPGDRQNRTPEPMQSSRQDDKQLTASAVIFEACKIRRNAAFW